MFVFVCACGCACVLVWVCACVGLRASARARVRVRVPVGVGVCLCFCLCVFGACIKLRTPIQLTGVLKTRSECKMVVCNTPFRFRFRALSARTCAASLLQKAGKIVMVSLARPLDFLGWGGVLAQGPPALASSKRVPKSSGDSQI